MKKYIAILAALFVAFLVPSAASASECVPQDAWTETIEHPEVSHIVHHDAVTHVVHHPEVSHIVHHEAIVTIVHHEAVTHIEHHEAVTHEETVPGNRYKWNPKRPVDESETPGTNPHNDPDHWQLDHKGYDGSPLEQYIQEGHGNGGNNASWFWWTAEVITIVDVEAYDETVVDEPAWDEEVITPAWDETVVDVEAWDETVTDEPAHDEIVIDEEAWTETIEHEAIDCPIDPVDPTDPVDPIDPEPVDPVIPVPTEPDPDPTHPVVPDNPEPKDPKPLPNTGAPDVRIPLGLAITFLVSGGWLLFGKRKFL